MYRNLCIVLALFAVSKSTFTVAGPVNILLAMKHCQEAHNISDDQIRQILSQKLNSAMNDPNGQCFVGCLLEETRILKSDGTIDSTNLINTVPRGMKEANEVTEEFRKCADQPGEGCEKKFKIAVCIESVENLIRFRKSGKMGNRSGAQ